MKAAFPLVALSALLLAAGSGCENSNTPAPAAIESEDSTPPADSVAGANSTNTVDESKPQPSGDETTIGDKTGGEQPNTKSGGDNAVALNAPGNASTSTAKEETVLIPRKQLFGNPEKARARISPDGTKLAYLAPVEGVLNVLVGPADNPDAAKPVTKERGRPIRSFFWAYTSQHVLYSQDKDGDEDFHVYSVNLETDEIKDLTPIEKIHATLEGVSEKFPEQILVGINDRDERYFHDVYRVNVVTGEREMIQKNPGFAGFMIDDDYRVRFALNNMPDASQQYYLPDPDAESGWKDWMKIDAEDAMTTGPVGFNKAADKLYFLDSRGRDTAALKIIDLMTNEETLFFENDKADISGIEMHPTEKNIEAVTYTYARREWKVFEKSFQEDLDYLKTVADGEVQITSRTLDDTRWTVAYLMDNGPVQFYLYDRQPEKKATFLFTSQPALEKLPLVNMHPVIVKSRDGLDLVCYLSLPKETDPDGDGRPSKPLPMVLNVHGGPWARDSWGFDPEHQMFANRGYAVLSVNYRGSTGFGKKFVNAGNKEWAGKMHNDLIDAVNWAIEEKIALKDKVAISGGSYGGYATLVGLTFTPDVFACGVDVVGPSSLITLLNNPPPYWYSFLPVMKLRVGDWETEEGKAFLNSRSPLNKVDQIKRPLLIVQGAQDPRVKQAEADQIVAEMNAKKIPVTYLLYPKEGHGLARPENRFSEYAVTEAFLAENLGGRYEPIGDAFEGADFTVPSGAGDVPGLAEALKEK